MQGIACRSATPMCYPPRPERKASTAQLSASFGSSRQSDFAYEGNPSMNRRRSLSFIGCIQLFQLTTGAPSAIRPRRTREKGAAPSGRRRWLPQDAACIAERTNRCRVQIRSLASGAPALEEQRPLRATPVQEEQRAIRNAPRSVLVRRRHFPCRVLISRTTPVAERSETSPSAL
jgi:hypothetical protein